MEDYKTVINERRDQLRQRSDSASSTQPAAGYCVLNKCVTSDLLDSGALNEVCLELNGDSCLGRNWTGLAIPLISPDKYTIDELSKNKNPASELLERWLNTANNENKTSFDALLDAMVAAQVFSAADELLIYLESQNGEDISVNSEWETEEIDENFTEHQAEIVPVCKEPNIFKSETSRKAVKKHQYRRSKSLKESFSKAARRIFLKKRSMSCPEPILETKNVAPVERPKKKEDEIFIVSSREDSQTEAVKKLESFVRNLKGPKKGQWNLKTIHDLPSGELITTAWLTDRVERAAYVIICCSSNIKQISDHRNENTDSFQQSEFNLKFTLDFLITGTLYKNFCRNPNGKFLPILLPGNNFSCVMQPLAFFIVCSWPTEEDKIRNYINRQPERTASQLGPRKPLVSKQLP